MIVLVDINAAPDLHCRDDSESHFEVSHDVRPSLAFMQKTGAWPKLEEETVIEVLPEDSNPSAIAPRMTTTSKLNWTCDGPTDECNEARTTTAALT